MDRISQYIKSVGGIQQETWNFYYGPTGIDKVTRTQGGIQNLSIDYTTDPNGRILSMTYTETGGYSGELFYTFDSFGNTATLTDTQGNVIVGYLYDLNNGKIVSEYNPYGIDNLFISEKAIILETGEITLIKDLEISSTELLNDWGTINPEGNAVGPWPYYAPLTQFIVWWLYHMEDWSLVDLCECFPPVGFDSDKIRNAENCDKLKQIMEEAEKDWNDHVDLWNKSGDIHNADDVIGYLSFPMFDTPCQTMARDGCEYWTAKDEWEKRGCK